MTSTLSHDCRPSEMLRRLSAVVVSVLWVALATACKPATSAHAAGRDRAPQPDVPTSDRADPEAAGDTMPSSLPSATALPSDAALIVGEDPDDPIGWAAGVTLISQRGGPRLMLEALSGRPQEHGQPRLASGDGYVVVAEMPARTVPERYAALSRQSVEVLTSTGKRCQARIGRFAYQVDVVPDSYEWERWEALAPLSEATDPERVARQRESLAKQIWQSAYGVWITAELDLTEAQHCRGIPLVARSPQAPSIRISRQLATVPQQTAVLRAFRDLPLYRDIAREYAEAREEDPELAEAWDEDERAPRLQAFALGTEVYVSVSVAQTGCTPWDPSLWALFQITDEGPKPVHTSGLRAPYEMHAIARDGDGSLIYLAQEDYPAGLSALRGDQRLLSWSSEFHGCGC